MLDWIEDYSIGGHSFSATMNTSVGEGRISQGLGDLSSS